VYMVLPSGINAQHVGTFWMLPLDATTTGNVVPRVPATFQRIGPEATPLLTQAMERNDPAEVYQRFATGRCCYASQTGIALAGFQPIADIVIDCVLTLRRPWLRGRPGIPEQLVMDIRRAVFGDAARAWLAVLTREN